MKRLTVSLQTITDQRAAVEKLAGYPRPPSFVGGALAGLVPDVFTPGALGWTEHVCAIQVSEDGQTAWIDVPNEIVDLYDGVGVDLDGRTVFVDFSSAIDVGD